MVKGRLANAAPAVSALQEGVLLHASRQVRHTARAREVFAMPLHAKVLKALGGGRQRLYMAVAVVKQRVSLS